MKIVVNSLSQRYNKIRYYIVYKTLKIVSLKNLNINPNKSLGGDLKRDELKN